jgi:diguanylate cyclase (GGDEF)-like protein
MCRQRPFGPSHVGRFSFQAGASMRNPGGLFLFAVIGRRKIMRRWTRLLSRRVPRTDAPAGAGRWIGRACVAGLLVVLCFLAGFSLLTETGLAGEAARGQSATRLSELYGDARFYVGQEESLENQYLLEPSRSVLTRHAEAGRSLDSDLDAIVAIDHSATTRQLTRQLLLQQARYANVSASMFAAVDRHDTQLAIDYDHKVVDPLFGAIETAIDSRTDASLRQAVHGSDRLRARTVSARGAIALAFGVGILLLGAFSLILLRLRRRVSAGHRAEVERLASAALFDSLTGLRNHRAFYEDLARELRRRARAGRPLALVMLDLNALKAVNDARGHQAGDERLKTLADTLRDSLRGRDCAYRVGGDEFMVILPDARAGDAMEATQRLQTALTKLTLDVRAGIAETSATDVDEVIRRADLALIASKRHHQAITLYSPELEPTLTAPDDVREAEHISSLSSALALAVDAKDSYTRSHCQTVSQLCALIATELALKPAVITQMRLAGLLHDVGKIGIPDAILTKPAALTDAEYDQMKRHSILGEQIVAAAELPEEARWVRHHHERYDGKGYPDGLAGENIPLQSRIILTADAFEAMTSDRPYRKAPGREFAIAELQRHAGTQFDPEIVRALCQALNSATISTPNPDRPRLPVETLPAAPFALISA